MKWLRRVLTVIAALTIVAGAGVYGWLRLSLPQVSGDIALDGLGAPVEVRRTQNLI